MLLDNAIAVITRVYRMIESLLNNVTVPSQLWNFRHDVAYIGAICMWDMLILSPSLKKIAEGIYNTQKKHLLSVIIHNVWHKSCHAHDVLTKKNKKSINTVDVI